MEKGIEKLLAQLGELEEALAQPGVFSDQKAYRKLAQKHSYLNDVKKQWVELDKCRRDLADNQELLQVEKDPEFQAVLQEEIEKSKIRIPIVEKKLEELLVPPDPMDHRPVIMELRAGTGGDEAALFVGDCLRMYSLYADTQGWKYEELSSAPSEMGGYKEYIMAISGQNVHRFLQYEAGTHRVQRVPATEAQGRVHTSAITVAVLLEPDEEEDFELDEKELRIETYRSSGAGGQHVNTTDSAVRITHLPTGAVTYCQQERSQHKNKDKAMRMLKAIIVDEQRRKREAELASKRLSQVGSGDRSERIRTYNYAQNRLTDHRIGLTLYFLDRILNGDLDQVIQALVTFFYAKKLDAVGNEND